MKLGYVICPQCKERFYRDEPWKRLCYDCWSFNNSWTAQDRITELEDRIRHLRMVLEEAETEKYQLKKHLPTLINYCHPDRHNNDPKANEVTAWLISQRKQLEVQS